MLGRRGYTVSILTRGYRRASEKVERVRAGDDAALHGDEPVLLAQSTGAAVFVGADRYAAGLVAELEEDAGAAVHLLDDGFQHQRLARDVDIALLTAEDVEDSLLPAGNLREPVAAVGEAQVVVVREEEAEALRGLLDGLRQQGHGFRTWTIRRTLGLPEAEPLPTLPLAFCGIARPEGFTRMLAASRYEPVETVVFADHHAYSDDDMTRLIQYGRRSGANGFVTTEKDAVKLTAAMRERLESVGPVVVARLKVELMNEKEALEQLVSMVGGGMERRRNRQDV